MKLVLIHWNDSARCVHEWERREGLEEFPDTPMRCQSVGFVFKENKEAVFLISTLGNDDAGNQEQFVGGLVIPKSAITEMKVLKP